MRIELAMCLVDYLSLKKHSNLFFIERVEGRLGFLFPRFFELRFRAWSHPA